MLSNSQNSEVESQQETQCAAYNEIACIPRLWAIATISDSLILATDSIHIAHLSFKIYQCKFVLCQALASEHDAKEH